MDEQEEQYICVGVCMPDPDSGYCLGCGRPPLGTPTVVAEVAPIHSEKRPPVAADPDSPPQPE